MSTSPSPNFILLIDTFSTPNLSLLQSKFNVKIICHRNILNESESIGYPDLIIVCDNVMRLYLKDPLLLSEAEIWFSRVKVNEKVVRDALRHFERCVRRGGG